jgi:hypothetical protein
MHLKLPFDPDVRELAVFEDAPSLQLGHVPRDATRLDPRLLELFSERDIGISHCEAFHTPPNRWLPIHIDHDRIGNMTKLNFCFGAKGSKMTWWAPRDPTKIPEYRISVIGTKYIYFDMKDCRIVGQTEIGQPTLVNVGQPHSVMNSTKEHRWVLSIVLWDKRNNTLLEMPEAHERFKDLV